MELRGEDGEDQRAGEDGLERSRRRGGLYIAERWEPIRMADAARLSPYWSSEATARARLRRRGVADLTKNRGNGRHGKKEAKEGGKTTGSREGREMAGLATARLDGTGRGRRIERRKRTPGKLLDTTKHAEAGRR